MLHSTHSLSDWEEQTLSLSYMDWTHRPSISIPKRIQTDLLHTHNAGYTLLFPVCGIPYCSFDLPFSLNSPDILNDMRIWIQGCDCFIEAKQSRIQTHFHPLLSPTMIPSLWICNTASSNAREAFHPFVVVSEEMQHSLGICTVTDRQ